LGGGDAGAAVAGAGRTGPGPPVPAGAMCHVPCTSTRDIKKKSPIVWNTTDNRGDRLAVRIGGWRQSSTFNPKTCGPAYYGRKEIWQEGKMVLEVKVSDGIRVVSDQVRSEVPLTSPPAGHD